MAKTISKNVGPKAPEAKESAQSVINTPPEEINIPKRIVEIVKTEGSYKSKEDIAKVLYFFSIGTSVREVAKRCNMSVNTALGIKEEHKEELSRIETDNAVKKVSQEERVINKLLNLTEKKADRLEKDTARLDDTRFTEITGAIKEIQNKRLLDEGKATSITRSINPQEFEKAKLEIYRTLQLIDNNDDHLLLEHLVAKIDGGDSEGGL